MAASSRAVMKSLLRRCGHCCSVISALPTEKMVLQLNHVIPARLVSTSAALLQKNLAAAGPEKYTQEFIKKQIEEFNIGKRHLANIMGEDPENFTQEDIDRSIEYLFPSGLFDKRARPVMKHPDVIFPKQRAVQWDQDGRPFHYLFFTGKPTYYSLMHEALGKVLAVEKYQDRMRSKGLLSPETKPMSLPGGRWLTKTELEELLVEFISEQDYTRFLQLMDKLASLPCSSQEEEFILRYHKRLDVQSIKQVAQPLQLDEEGVAFSSAQGRRKTAEASVVMRDLSSGKILINGVDYLRYFTSVQDRQELMFPLQFVGRLGRHALECTVSGGGHSAQAGALRLAIARALLSFVSESERESMRQAGLLTSDPRVKERKKPGQEGARRKFTWKKR
ncbi:28S ribosomal protein S9, mitochondrial [Anguilla rostrata]|uniref:28S ribosomal protein S9, mitochondrial n=1 Tax=Anguilla rostrata TaxID=7938 RepID=UPI0030D0E9AD